MTDILTVPPTATAVDQARKANRLFLDSIASFVGLVLTIIIGLADRQTAQDLLAQELGVELNAIPADRLADIIRETWSTPACLLTGASR